MVVPLGCVGGSGHPAYQKELARSVCAEKSGGFELGLSVWLG